MRNLGQAFLSLNQKILIVGLLFLSACTGKKDAAPIVIPPGGIVQFSNAEFVEISEEFYNVELKMVQPQTGESFSIKDMTPSEDKTSVRNISYILPKDKNEQGFFVVQVNITKLNMALRAIVLPDVVATPGLVSTIVADLVLNYPGKRINQFTVGEIKGLEDLVRKRVAKVGEEYDLSLASTRKLLKFYKNAVVGDMDTLEQLEDFGLAFAFDSVGVVTTAPFPYGVENKSPNLDQGNSTPLNKQVRGMEKEELIVRAAGLDPEDDFIAYRWRRSGELVSREPMEYRWVPDFHEGRVAPYVVDVAITDGGAPLRVQWDVIVEDNNRKPVITENCEKTLTEWQPWTCRISAVDYDGDEVYFEINDKFVQARVTVDGQKTDDITRRLVISGKSFIEIQFTPDNRDAKNRSGYIELTVSDGKMGNAVIPLNLTIQDINGVPYLAAGPIPFRPGPANEWDWCAQLDPDNPLDDPEMSGYRFMIEVVDPDNAPEAAPRNQHPDQVTVTFGGTLRSQVGQFFADKGCPASTPEKKTFCFLWRPEHGRKTGTLTLQMKDDHGGLSEIQVVQLEAEDRNSKPCLTTTGFGANLSEQSLQVFHRTTSEDLDGTAPNIGLVGDGPSFAAMVPFLEDVTAVKKVVARRKFYETDFRYFGIKGAESISAMEIKASFSSPYAGTAVLTRALPHSSAVVVPAGYQFETTLGSGKKIKYQTAVAASFEASDLQLMIPVQAIERDVAIGKLNRHISAPPQPDLTVTNLTAFTGVTETVRLTRVDTTASLIIPMGFVFGTSELADGVSTVRYVLKDMAVMGVGVATLDVTVRRQPLVVNSGELGVILSAALPGPPLQVSNITPLQGRNGYSLNGLNQTGTTLGVDRFCLKKQALDGSIVSVNGINAFEGMAPIAGLTVRNALAIELDGVVEFTRPTTAGSEVVPSGTLLRTNNGTRFELTGAVTLTAGQASAQGVVKRVDHQNPVDGSSFDTLCLGWTDMNWDPKFISSSATMVQEGSAITNFKVEVADDYSSPDEPKDPADRHVFNGTIPSGAPDGSWLFCRNAGTDVNNIAIPACQPCTNTDGTDYFDANYCYFRFKPALSDGSKSFQWKIEVNDNGMLSPIGTNIRNQYFSVSVVEENDAPVFTDGDYNTLIGNTELSPQDIGVAVEGNPIEGFIFAKDFDLGAKLKTLAFNIENTVYDVQSAQWVAAPRGLSVGVVSSNLNPNPSYGLNPPGGGLGWGSLYGAKIAWTPDDEGAKRFAGNDGFVVKVRVYDSISDPPLSKFAYGYFRFRVVNNNNAPYLLPLSGGEIPVTVNEATTSQTLVVRDADYYALGAPANFTPSVSLCQQALPFSTPASCDAPKSNWPVELLGYDDPYVGNASVAACRNGAGGPLNTSVALPYIKYLNSASCPTCNPAYGQNQFQIQWCAQKRHIGEHVAFLQIKDNGDTDRNSVSKPELAITVPILFKVTAPVFFESPRKNSLGQIDLWMKQAYATVSPAFTYATIVNNSKKTALLYSVTSSPAQPACGQTGGICISNTGVITWQPLAALIGTTVNLTVRVQASASEFDVATFPVEIKNAISPVNAFPVISDSFPIGANVVVDERTNNTFSVVASDSVNDYLHYRWYVNDVITKDDGPSFVYMPGYQDGFTAGKAGLRPGQHEIRVEVTDGNKVVSRLWNVTVRNTIPSPQLAWQMSSTLAGITNLNWSMSQPVATTSGVNTINFLAFTGSYTRASLVRNFIWSVRFQNGVFNSGTAQNYFEGLPWPAGRKSERIAINMLSATNFETMITSQLNRNGPFSSTTDAVKLPLTYAGLTITPSHSCTGVCAQKLYTSSFGGYGSRATASLIHGGENLFYANNANDGLLWDKDSSDSTQFYTLPSPLRISDMVVNPTTKRLYVTAKDVGTAANKILIFDVADVDTGSAPDLITILNVSDGVDPDNRIGDIVVNSVTNKIYASLPGTGGVVMLEDSSGTPVEGDLQFIGVGTIGKSYSDIPRTGRKVALDSNEGLLYGVAKDASQVYVINLDSNAVNVFGSEVGLDEIVTYTNDKLTLGISRSLGRVYIIK